MPNDDSQKQQTPTDYEALNNAFYSIVDSWLPKDFGQKGLQQTDADVLVKIRKAKEKERHRALNLEHGNAATSNIPHANLLKRKLQSSGSQTSTSKGADASAGDNGDDDESEEESRTRSVGKKSKTGYDAFSKPGKGKSKGKQKDTGSGMTVKASSKGEENASSNGRTSSPTDSKNVTNATNPSQTYHNPFAMPATVNSTPSERSEAALESTPSTDAVAPQVIVRPQSEASTSATDELSKNQRKKQRKKEKKALAREESAKLQQDALGKLAVTRPDAQP